MCPIAAPTKRTMKTAVIGISRPLVGRPPKEAFLGGYGACIGFDGWKRI